MVRRPEREPLKTWVYPLVTVFAWAIGILLALRFFRAFAFLLLGGLAAGSLAAALKPLRDRIPGPRWLAGTLTGLIPIVVGGALPYLLAYLITGPIADELQQWPAMRENLNRMLATWSGWFNLSPPITVETLWDRAKSYLSESGADLAASVPGVISMLAAAIILIFIGSLYLQAEPPTRIVTPILKMLPLHRRAQFQHAFDDLVPRLRWWLIGTFIDMVVVGVVAWVLFWLGGVPLSSILAILTGISEIVPTIGPAFMFVVTLLFAAAAGTRTVLIVMGAFAAIHMLEGYVLQPLVMRQAVRVLPIITLFTVVLWSEVFGLPGLFLALPINLLIWSFVDHFLMRRYEQPTRRTS